MGAGYYTDEYDVDEFAFYIQTPIVEYGWATINFGGMFPMNHFGRSRPHASLDLKLFEYRDLKFEAGVYGMASPYMAWGGHMGLACRF